MITFGPATLKRCRVLLQICAIAAAGTASTIAADPEFNYLLHCGGCHLEDGAGDPPAVPDLRATIGVLSSMPKGRAYLAQVPGSSQAPLNDTELADVLNWMLDRYSDGAQGDDFTAGEIARYRSGRLMDPLKVRAQILNSPPANGL